MLVSPRDGPNKLIFLCLLLKGLIEMFEIKKTYICPNFELFKYKFSLEFKKQTIGMVTHMS